MQASEHLTHRAILGRQAGARDRGGSRMRTEPAAVIAACVRPLPRRVAPRVVVLLRWFGCLFFCSFGPRRGAHPLRATRLALLLRELLAEERGEVARRPRAREEPRA